MGIIFDDVTKTWTARYAKRNPKTGQPKTLRRTLIKTEAEAKRIERSLIALIERKFHEKNVPKWKTLVESFLSASLQQGMMAKTVDNYSVCLKAHTQAWNEKRVDKITTEEIRELIKARVGERAPSHQKNVLKFVRRTFNHGVETGVLNRNPAPNIKFKVGDKIKRVLTEEQAKRLLARAKELDSEWYPHWAMAIYTGMRNGELFALTWDKVNLDERQVLVDCSWNNKDGFKSTKSGDDRICEIAPPLLPMLRELKLNNSDSTFVLPRIESWERGCQAVNLRMFLLGIGLPSVAFHDLRATWATLMLSKGVEPIKVMKMGGWKDLKTMMIYARKAGVDIKGITDCLELHNPSTMPARVLGFPSL